VLGRAYRLDAVGAALVAITAAWIIVVAVAGGSNPLPTLATLLATAGSLVLARGVAIRGRPLGPAALVAVAGVLALVSLGGLARAAGAPLLYANANAAFFVQASLAGLMVAVAWDGRPARIAGLAIAAAFAGVVLLTGSRAGVLLLLVLLPAVAMAGRPGAGARILTVAGGGAVIVALIVTVLVAGGIIGGRAGRQAAGVVSLGRVRLWSQALQIMEERPVFGVGPGRFQVASRTARSDRELGWAHHEFLQLGAEAGLPGLLLLLAAFLWAFARLWVSPPDAVTGVAAASLAALGVHACFDYILHFPVLPVAAAALVGTAQASRDRSPEDARPGALLRKALKASVIPFGMGSRRRGGDVSVLLYHRVGAGRREVDLSVPTFERQAAALTASDAVLSMDEALADGRPGGVVLTVDDGLRDFHEHVLPVLVKHRLPAVLYLATGLVVEEGGDRAEGLGWSQLRDAVGTGLVTVGSHTHNHANLASASEDEAETEMRRSQELIEDRLGVPCRHFAYPWGVGSAEADRAARRLFDSAALAWGTNRAGRIDRYRLARVPVLRSDGPVLFRAKVEGRLDREAVLYRVLGRGPWRRR
jgi:peptidoglycan/xylan/chitin deacetylase (PgdA/CDA1 family)/O-antigen ligase